MQATYSALSHCLKTQPGCPVVWRSQPKVRQTRLHSVTSRQLSPSWKRASSFAPLVSRGAKACNRSAMAAKQTENNTAPPSQHPQVAVVTTVGCAYCKRAKEALRQAGFAYEEIELSRDLDLLRSIQQATGVRTVPQVLFSCCSCTRCTCLGSVVRFAQAQNRYALHPGVHRREPCWRGNRTAGAHRAGRPGVAARQERWRGSAPAGPARCRRAV